MCKGYGLTLQTFNFRYFTRVISVAFLLTIRSSIIALHKFSGRISTAVDRI